jgi:nucleoside-diphosphate-sugar epimerase
MAVEWFFNPRLPDAIAGSKENNPVYKMILITGSSGFLGRHIAEEIAGNHTVKTLNTLSGDYHVKLDKEIPQFNEAFSTVVHVAGKAHMVPKTERDSQLFFDVNVGGTKNLLSALEKNKPPQHFVFISSVAVYGLTSGKHISEDAPLLATDSYGKSKIIAEEIVKQWCDRHHVVCTILRLPLVVGTDPPANLKNMIQAIRAGYYFDIGGGRARKSMVMASDIARYILPAAIAGGTYNLTDGEHPSFGELSDMIAGQCNRKKPFNLPYAIAKLLALAGDVIGSRFPVDSRRLDKITSSLTFDDQKARHNFGWAPMRVLTMFKIYPDAK